MATRFVVSTTTSRFTYLLGSLLLRCPFQFVRLISESRAHNGVRSVHASTAYELQRTGYAFLDVRTSDEFKAGHPLGAINIPYMFQTHAGMSKNPKFQEEVSVSFKKDDQIVIGCRSGKRSLMAATELTSLGFKNIVDLAGGYTAWTEKELPVQKVE